LFQKSPFHRMIRIRDCHFTAPLTSSYSRQPWADPGTERGQPCPRVCWQELQISRATLSTLLFPTSHESAVAPELAGPPNSSSASCGARRMADLEIGAPGARFMVPMQARSELRLPSRTPPGCWPPRQTNTLPDGEGQDGGEILGRTRNV